MRRTSPMEPRTASRLLDDHGGRARGAAAGLVEEQEDAGEDLSELVVELARDPQALGLLCGEGSPRALAPLVLQAIEHGVEGVGQRGDVGVGAPQLDAAARRERVDALHGPPQLVEGREGPLEQQEVQDERRADRRDEHEHLGGGDGRADRRRAGPGRRRRRRAPRRSS